MKVKKKKCRVCGTEFTPFFSTTVVCNNLECAKTEGQRRTAKQEAKRKRIEKKQIKQAIEALEPPSYWIKKLKPIFNRYIRERDKHQPCISCERHTLEENEQWDCGHFRTVGSSPHLRFVEDNAHKQCSSCNRGSEKYIKKRERIATAYDTNLIQRIGQERVDAVKNDNEARKYTSEQLQEMIKHYKTKCKELAE